MHFNWDCNREVRLWYLHNVAIGAFEIHLCISWKLINFLILLVIHVVPNKIRKKRIRKEPNNVCVKNVITVAERERIAPVSWDPVFFFPRDSSGYSLIMWETRGKKGKTVIPMLAKMCYNPIFWADVVFIEN